MTPSSGRKELNRENNKDENSSRNRNSSHSLPGQAFTGTLSVNLHCRPEAALFAPTLDTWGISLRRSAPSSANVDLGSPPGELAPSKSVLWSECY